VTAPTAAPAPRPLVHRIGEELLPNLAVLTSLVAPVAVWSRLPDPMASHWGTSGRPDASLSLVADVVLLCVVTAVVAYGPIVAARFPMPRAQAQVLVAVAGFGSVLLAGVRIASVRANLDAPSWEAAASLSGGVVAMAVAAGLVAGLVGWAAASSRPDLPAPSTQAPIEVEVTPGEAVVWTSGASSRTPVLIAALLLLVAAVGALLAPPEARTVLVIVLPLVALALAAFGQVRATIGPRGVTVACGWLGFPRLRVPIEDVADVSVEDVVPTSYGGWGLRQVPGATAVIVRRGEGIRVERRSGRVFVVTVDDAARGAGVLLAHRDAATTPAN
jgi:hypothetical protein